MKGTTETVVRVVVDCRTDEGDGGSVRPETLVGDGEVGNELNSVKTEFRKRESNVSRRVTSELIYSLL